MSESSYIFAKTRLSMEIWRDIEGYEGLYQVSNEGRIKSIKKRKILSLFANHKGYLQTYLYKNGEKKGFLVHRLVAEAFIPNPMNLPQVNHKDENKTNNSVENLEWCTNDYNINYSQSKKVYQYTLNNDLVKIWNSTMELGRNGFSQPCISLCCNGKKQKHKGYKWSYYPL